jgi:hypothetical protein
VDTNIVAYKFRSRAAEARQHPAGFTMFLRPFDPDKALDFQDLVDKFTTDGVRESDQYRQMAAFVADEIVETIPVEDANGVSIECTPEVKLMILRDASQHLVERPVWKLGEDGKPLIEGGVSGIEGGVKVVRGGKRVQATDDDGKPLTQTVPANEPHFIWAFSEAGVMWSERQAATKNS